MVTLTGSGVPAVGRSIALGPVAATSDVHAVVVFKPRNAFLLRRLARASSGRPGLSEARIDSLFAPDPARVRAVRAYLDARGLTVTGRTDMTMTVSGAAAAAEQAFGVALRVFRSPSGGTFEAPASPIRLPAAIAGAVRTVAGLGGGVRLRPASGHLKLHRSAAGITPTLRRRGCGPAQARRIPAGQPRPGARLRPQQPDRSGRRREWRGDRDGRVLRLCPQRRAPLPHLLPGDHRDVLARRDRRAQTPDRSGKTEVALDLEVAMAAAPDADLRAYIAPNEPGYAPVVFDQMRQDGVDVISDSWGACEPLISPALLPAEDTSLELAAVAGISTYVATGDFGSTDCFPFTGSTNLFVDDPSSQPFATAVGGTALEVPPEYPKVGETAWHGSGGGVSMWWPKPAYQLGKTIPVARAQVPRRPGPVPRDARRLARRASQAHRLHHLLQPLRRRPRHRLGAGRRHERRRAADGCAHRRRRRVGRQAARVREPVPLRTGRHGRLPRHRLGDEQPLRRPPLHRQARVRPGDGARLDPGRGVRRRRSPPTRRRPSRSTRRRST